MALIICSECSKEFSDKAAACPNCGCPTEKQSVIEVSAPKPTIEPVEHVKPEPIRGNLGVTSANMSASKPQKSKAKGCLISIVIFIVLCAFINTITPSSDSDSSSKNESSSKSESSNVSSNEYTPKNVMSVDYVDMWDYYSDSVYKNEWVKFTGKVSDIGSDGEILINDELGKYSYDRIEIDSIEELSRTISKGEIITVTGVVVGKYAGTLNVENARVELANDRDILKMEEYAEIRQEKEEALAEQEKELAEQAIIEAQLAYEKFIEQAESPSYLDLQRYPEKYKTIPIKVTVYIKEVEVQKFFNFGQGDYQGTINGQDVLIKDNRIVKEPKLLKGETVVIYGYGRGQATLQTKREGLIRDKVVDEQYIPAIQIEYLGNR